MNNNDERDFEEERAVQAEYERECESEGGHVDYPHNPGQLYDCQACEAECFCGDLSRETLCVHCSLNVDVAAIIYREGNGHTVTSYVPPF